jgi:hypothetical protein
MPFKVIVHDLDTRSAYEVRQLMDDRHQPAILGGLERPDGLHMRLLRGHLPECRLIYDRLPTPKQVQTFVQVWRQLWKWR